MSTLTTQQKWLIFAGLALSVVMVDIDITASNLALSTISQSLQMPLSSAQWLIDGYTMAAAALMAFGGRSGDLYGHKRVFQFALLLFTIASALVGLSHNGITIVLSRIFQGGCIAFTFPLATIIARQIFPLEKQGFVIGLLISIAGISQAIGPTFGSLVIHFASWRWIFLLNIPFALTAFYLVNRYLPHLPKNQNKANSNVLSLSLLIVGVFSLITALNEVVHIGATSWIFLSLLGLSGLSFIGFGYREWHSQNPLLDLRLLINRVFGSMIIVRAIISYVYFSWLFLLSLLLQRFLGYSAVRSGLMMCFLTLITAIFAVPTGKLIDRKGTKKLMVIGFVIMLIALIWFIMMMQHPTMGNLIIGFILGGFSITLLIPTSATASIKSVAMKRAGAAMGVLLTCSFLGGALGVAVSGWVLGNTIGQVNFSHGFVVSMLIGIVFALFGTLLCVRLPRRT